MVVAWVTFLTLIKGWARCLPVRAKAKGILQGKAIVCPPPSSNPEKRKDRIFLIFHKEDDGRGQTPSHWFAITGLANSHSDRVWMLPSPPAMLTGAPPFAILRGAARAFWFRLNQHVWHLGVTGVAAVPKATA